MAIEQFSTKFKLIEDEFATVAGHVLAFFKSLLASIPNARRYLISVFSGHYM